MSYDTGSYDVGSYDGGATQDVDFAGSTLLTFEQVCAHLRLELDYPADQLEGKLLAAQALAQEFMNRRIFATQYDLDAAVAAMPAYLQAAYDTYTAATVAANLIQAEPVRCMALQYALDGYTQASRVARETYAGIVLNPLVTAGILLILGHLFENRQDVQTGAASQIPMGSQHVLQPLRVGMGV